MKDVLGHGDSWLISLLYIGTFGSFIGFGFAFAQVLNIVFTAQLTGGATPTAAQTAAASLHAAQIAFVGPLLGSVSRIAGGKLADRIGGGRVTLWTFLAMVASAGVLVAAGRADDATRGAATSGQLAGLITGFVLLFVLSGVGNGSVYKMIPSIFERKSRALNGVSREQRTHWSRAMSGALIGIAGAIGALGGFLINLVLRQSYLTSKSATTAFWIFLAFYVLAASITYVRYVRQSHGDLVEAPVEAPATS